MPKKPAPEFGAITQPEATDETTKPTAPTEQATTTPAVEAVPQPEGTAQTPPTDQPPVVEPPAADTPATETQATNAATEI